MPKHLYTFEICYKPVEFRACYHVYKDDVKKSDGCKWKLYIYLPKIDAIP